MLKQYETVFIATPVLSDQQMKEAVAKYTQPRLCTKKTGASVSWLIRSSTRPPVFIISSSSRPIPLSSRLWRPSIIVTRGSSGT